MPSVVAAESTRRGRRISTPVVGLLVVIVLCVVAGLVPVLTGWHVKANAFPPLSANWRPRWGIGTLPAVLLGLAVIRYAPALAARLPWPRLLAATFGSGLVWLLTLALVDGRSGLAAPLDVHGYNNYLPTARAVHDLSALLPHFVERIPRSAPNWWPDHVAGHPPGTLLFFVLLVRVGLGGGLAAGLVVTVIAATTPVALLVAVRRVAGDTAARRAVFLAFGPMAIWSAVSGDAVFAACVAWLVAAAAIAATSRGRARMTLWALLSGLAYGVAMMLSYGLALVGLFVLAVLWATRTARPVVPFVAGAAAVFAVVTGLGFRWWTALGPLHDRYYAGIAHLRPASYWIWGDLAALCFSAGPAIGLSLGVLVPRIRALWRGPSPTRAVVALATASLACVVCADASLLSKAEVERIWLPFVPWLLLGVVLLPERARNRALAGQVVFALVLQTLLFTRW